MVEKFISFWYIFGVLVVVEVLVYYICDVIYVCFFVQFIVVMMGDGCLLGGVFCFCDIVEMVGEFFYGFQVVGFINIRIVFQFVF